MSYLKPEVLEELRCKLCKKYLSQFPVYLYIDGSSICGRCTAAEGEVIVWNESYENLAEDQKFPCCHDTNGCLENLYPMDMRQHEKFCSFRTIVCSENSFLRCNWSGFNKDLLEHFKLKHRTFILSEDPFEIDFTKSRKKSCLLPYGGNLYIVHRATDSKTNTFSCTINNIGTDPTADTFSYRIILESSIKSKMHKITEKLNFTTEIKGDIIRDILDDPISIIARIEIFQEAPVIQVPSADKGLEGEILKELECLVCMEYMVPPIHQCLTGHSICLRCKDRLQECPICKSAFQNTQNFALAQITNHITYPCKHSECEFTAKAKDIKKHESTCIFRPFKCPLNDYVGCDRESIFVWMYGHIRDNHYENLLETEVVTVVTEYNETIQECHIIPYRFQLFKLHFMFAHERFCWAMQLVGPDEESVDYKFEIDIVDSSNDNCRAYFKKKCGVLTHRDDAFADHKCYLSIEYGQIRSTELSYRVRVLEE